MPVVKGLNKNKTKNNPSDASASFSTQFEIEPFLKPWGAVFRFGSKSQGKLDTS